MDLIILIGLQASGKSTFTRARFAELAYVSKDAMRNMRDKNRRQQAMIRQALGERRSVLVDNTNPSPAVRAPLIALGREYGARVIGYYFSACLDDCLARNKKRGERACVPDVALYATCWQLQAPSYAEGFDELYSVVINAELGEFIVMEI